MMRDMNKTKTLYTEVFKEKNFLFNAI